MGKRQSYRVILINYQTPYREVFRESEKEKRIEAKQHPCPRSSPGVPGLAELPGIQEAPECKQFPEGLRSGCMATAAQLPGCQCQRRPNIFQGEWGSFLGVGTPLSWEAGTPLMHCFLGGDEGRGPGAGTAEGLGSGGLSGPEVSSPPVCELNFHGGWRCCPVRA